MIFVFAGTIVPRAQPCACFALCTDADALDFFSRLPVVTSTEFTSWLPFLRSIYNEEAPLLPIDLRTFGAWRVPGWKDTTSAALPLARSCTSSYMPCSTIECAGWLLPPTLKERAPPPCALSAAASGINCQAVAHVPPRGPIGPLSSGLQPRGQDASSFRALVAPYEAAVLMRFPVLVRRRPQRRPAARDGSWVEVVRHSSDQPEGCVYGYARCVFFKTVLAENYGAGDSPYPHRSISPFALAGRCWFYQLYAPFTGGSGIFVNVGRSLVLEEKPQLSGICRTRLQMRQFTSYPPELGSTPPELLRNGPDQRDQLSKQSDNHLAACLQRLGYDSAQILREAILLLATPACAIPGQRRLPGACPPVELRTGRNASRACICADRVGARKASQMNCRGGSAPLGVEADALRARAEAARNVGGAPSDKSIWPTLPATREARKAPNARAWVLELIERAQSLRGRKPAVQPDTQTSPPGHLLSS